jgi:hypothetical protein
LGKRNFIGNAGIVHGEGYRKHARTTDGMRGGGTRAHKNERGYWENTKHDG